MSEYPPPPTGANVLQLVDITFADNQIAIAYALDGLRFSNTIWYEDLSFDDLATRFGKTYVEFLVFHIAAFEINKLCSMRPKVLDWGLYQRFVTPRFAALWRTVFENVWAQWRFENDDPTYRGPAFDTAAGDLAITPPRGRPLDAGTISFCGGGKDSLVAMLLLSEIRHPFGALVYSASYYGTSRDQHALIDTLIDSFGVDVKLKQWIFDDFLDSPVLHARASWGVRSVTAAETPSSIFGVLPYVLDRGYEFVSLAHERSADAPQVIWTRTGEPVNHQWGKSYEAEALLNSYIQETLVPEFEYFSILKPIYDVAIFGMLRGAERHVVHTHSCNVRKPWCRRCAKCAYVWLGYTAFLDRDVVDRTFGGENLFDVADNTFLFRQLCGLEDQLPFECIGEAPEAALFLAMAARKGWTGRAFAACAEAWETLDWRHVAQKYLTRHYDEANIPAQLADRVKARLDDYAAKTFAYIEQLLGE